MSHVSVLLHEVIQGLDLKQGDSVLDGTFGGGGHSKEALKYIGPTGTLVGLDMDSAAVKRCEQIAAYSVARMECIEANYKDAVEVLAQHNIHTIDKVMLDIGLSSFQFEESGRGFSFKKDEPLRMTFNAHPTEETMTADTIVNTWDEENIATILWKYGEERFSRRIAKAIVEKRTEKQIETTTELAELISNTVPKRFATKIHPATKTFQALRITVNDELGNLRTGLSRIFDAVNPGGRIAVISFHSLEDRIVKQFFRTLKDNDEAELITKKPIVPSDEEVRENPRSRSAKLRIIQKI